MSEVQKRMLDSLKKLHQVVLHMRVRDPIICVEIVELTRIRARQCKIV